MIVDPDFLDHWKTRTLVGLLDGDEVAPCYVIRLWAHCQNRRKSVFDNLTSEALKALCHFPGNANKLESSLVASCFVRRDAKSLCVIGWDDYNSTLIAAWNNGRKGGRPPGKTGQNPRVSKRKPRDNPRVCDRIGLDEIREDGIRLDSKPPDPLLIPAELQTDDFLAAWTDWIQHRAEIRKPLKPTAIANKLLELARWGPQRAVAAIRYSIGNGWQGIFEQKDDGNGKRKPTAIGPGQQHESRKSLPNGVL